MPRGFASRCPAVARGFCLARRAGAVSAVALYAAAGLALVGCTSPLEHAERIAQRSGLESVVLPGTVFSHRAFVRAHANDGLLVLIVDGDGRPWTRDGMRVAADPTPHVPLALKLAAETPYSVLYLGRPCYFGLQRQAPCSARDWTSDRYAADIVASMVAAADSYIQAHGVRRVLLVGYSGGGTLVTLMAPHMPRAVGVVTIAGNLDPDAWTQVHGYAPLNGLNPALEPPFPKNVQEWHLIGDRDNNVPYIAAQRYLQRLPPDRISRYVDFDHTCCWEAEWPAVLLRVHEELERRNFAREQ